MKNSTKQKPDFKILKIRVLCEDKQYRTLHEALTDLACNRCGKVIPSGQQFLRRENILPIAILDTGEAKWDRKLYPVCSTCCPWQQ